MVRGLRPHVVGKEILSVQVRDPKLAPIVPTLALPATVASLSRRGKHILFDLGDRTLVLHLRMSGRLAWGTREPTGKVRLSLRFPDGGAHLVDPRRLGTTAVVERFVDELGPEP